MLSVSLETAFELAIDEECDEQGQEEIDHREQAPYHDICGGNALLGNLQLELRREFGHLAQVVLNDADGHTASQSST